LLGIETSSLAERRSPFLGKATAESLFLFCKTGIVPKYIKLNLRDFAVRMSELIFYFWWPEILISDDH